MRPRTRRVDWIYERTTIHIKRRPNQSRSVDNPKGPCQSIPKFLGEKESFAHPLDLETWRSKWIKVGYKVIANPVTNFSLFELARTLHEAEHEEIEWRPLRGLQLFCP
jgi:hypothetical protein